MHDLSYNLQAAVNDLSKKYHSKSHGLKNLTIVLIRDTISERDITRVRLPFANPSILELESDLTKKNHDMTDSQVTSAWEILSIFVEADCHYTVGSVEGFFDTIAMMAVYVNV